MSAKKDDSNDHVEGKSNGYAREAIIRSTKPGNDPQVRQYASILLGQLKDSECINALILALRDTDKKVRAQAALSLGGIGDPAVGPLISLMDDPDWKVRYRAAEALGITRSEKAIPSLISALDDQKDHVRYMAAKAIGEIGPGRAETALVRRLTDDNEFVRRSTVTALGKTGGNTVKQVLTEYYTVETSEGVRKEIRSAINLLEKGAG
jgi:HEAT repeat protein